METLGGAIGKKTLATLGGLEASGRPLRIADRKEMNVSEIKTRIEFFLAGRGRIGTIPSGEFRLSVIADIIEEVDKQKLQKSLRYLKDVGSSGREVRYLFKYDPKTGEIKNGTEKEGRIVELAFSSSGQITDVAFWNSKGGETTIEKGMSVSGVRVMATVAEYNFSRAGNDAAKMVKPNPRLVVDGVKIGEYKKSKDFHSAFSILKSIK